MVSLLKHCCCSNKHIVSHRARLGYLYDEISFYVAYSDYYSIDVEYFLRPIFDDLSSVSNSFILSTRPNFSVFNGEVIFSVHNPFRRCPGPMQAREPP